MGRASSFRACTPSAVVAGFSRLSASFAAASGLVRCCAPALTESVGGVQLSIFSFVWGWQRSVGLWWECSRRSRERWSISGGVCGARAVARASASGSMVLQLPWKCAQVGLQSGGGRRGVAAWGPQRHHLFLGFTRAFVRPLRSERFAVALLAQCSHWDVLRTGLQARCWLKGGRDREARRCGKPASVSCRRWAAA